MQVVSYRAGAGAAGAVQDAAGLVLLPRRLELAATHAGAAVLPQLAHAAGSGGTTVVPYPMPPVPVPVPCPTPPTGLPYWSTRPVVPWPL